MRLQDSFRKMLKENIRLRERIERMDKLLRESDTERINRLLEEANKEEKKHDNKFI